MTANAGEEIRSELGTIQIAPEVLAIIAGLATNEVEGVAGLSGGIAGGIAELLGRKNVSKGVEIKIEADATVIEVSVIVHYGVRIPDVSLDIQKNIQKTLSDMTGLFIREVNVHVLDVLFKQAEVKEEEPQPAKPALRVR